MDTNNQEITQSLIQQERDHQNQENETTPLWRDQITPIGLFFSALMGALFCIVTHKLNLSVGIIPSLDVAAGLLGFFSINSWISLLTRMGFHHVKLLTMREHTFIQTCVLACYGLAFSGGFGLYLIAMNEKTYNLIGPTCVKSPGCCWMVVFLIVVSFLGLFILFPLQQFIVMDNKITNPSGTATEMLINSFHTTEGATLAGKQMKCLRKYLSISLIWSCFKWFYSGVGNSCGFDNFPTFGLTLYKYTFYFNFSATYVGCGLICPHIVNFSVLIGAIVSWGLLWPFISKHAGDWFPPDHRSNDFKGLYGYKVFIAISLILGDGLYNLVKMMAITIREIIAIRSKEKPPIPQKPPDLVLENKKSDEIFWSRILSWFAGAVYVVFAEAGYVVFAAISTAIVPLIFPPLSWYLVLCAYIVAPAFAFCNSYGTDWSLASTYGKIGLFLFASIVGTDGEVIAGLAACGLMMSIVSTAADLIQDFNTGHLTLSSAKSMFVSQLIGTVMGCILVPLTFRLYWSTFDIGSPDGLSKAPYAVIFREMAILRVEGFLKLPKHCLTLSCGFFVIAMLINLLRDVTPARVSRFIPIPMAMSVPFCIGAYFAIDMLVGTVILLIWEQINLQDSVNFSGAVASGLICGDGIWTIMSAILSILRINPPICMQFRPAIRSGT